MIEKNKVSSRITEHDIIAGQFQNQACPEHVQHEITRILPDALTLIQPGITHCWAKISIPGKNLIKVACINKRGSAVLCPGSGWQMLKPAREVLIAAWTIGSRIDKKIKALNQAGKFLDAYLYDCAGLEALKQAENAVKELARKRAKENSWGVSALISPGSIKGWDLAEQKEFCALIDLDDIGLELNSHQVLTPFKSASGMIGIGPGYLSDTVGSSCMMCQKKQTCLKSDCFSQESKTIIQ